MGLLNVFSNSPVRLIKNLLKNKGIGEIVKETTDALHFRKTISCNEHKAKGNPKKLPIDIIVTLPISSIKTGKKTAFNMGFFMPIATNEENRRFYESFCNTVNNVHCFGGCFFVDLEFNRVAFRNAGQIVEDKSILEKELTRALSEGLVSINTFLEMYFNHDFTKSA